VFADCLSWPCHTQLELKLKLATSVGQIEQEHLHVPKMVELCLNVGPAIFGLKLELNPGKELEFFYV
jgi:hypothetical protein